jgi:hypothetical protein
VLLLLLTSLLLMCCCCRMRVSAGDAHQVVRNYLLFNGFGGTLAAFDTAAGVEGIAQPMW